VTYLAWDHLTDAQREEIRRVFAWATIDPASLLWGYAHGQWYTTAPGEG
jgi:hypothetical protein